MSSRTEAVGEAFQDQLGGWEPDGNMEVKDVLQGLSDMWQQAAQALDRMAESFHDHAIDPAVIDELKEHAAAVDGLRDSADQALHTLETKHEHDIDRLENPRPGEEGWDYTRNS